ncbi:MAG TPA: helix-turn-helix domain-containing protein [Rubrobacteraceae bacterium]|nr:helix-turn-helix domain-containing protein [Rubrobacteraceae bacterium]
MERVEKERERDGWALDFSGRQLPGGLERSDAARNRRRILAAARQLFGEKGVTRVTMEEVARTAGVGKGTLYRRFPNKGLLCEALLDEPTRRLQAEVLVSLSDPGRGGLEKLRNFLVRLVLFTEENLDLLYGGQDTLQGAERVARYGHPSYGWMRWTVLGLLREAARNGELDEEKDIEYLADAMLAPLNVDLYYHQSRMLGLSPGRISAGLSSMI